MGKLHELLAVEGDLEGVAKKVIQETATTFVKKPDHFQAFNKSYVPYNEGKENELPSEEKELVTTVSKKLDYAFSSIVKWLDAVIQKERTNQLAKADIIINGTTIASDIPVTFLLGLENKLKSVRDMIEYAPTLAPGTIWEPDVTLGEGVYRAKNQDERIRTQKVMKPVVLYEATDKHPAQVKESTEDVAIGKYIEIKWSSMISPAEKSVMLGRVDSLLRAVKQARMRANSTEVEAIEIGNVIRDYILKG